MVHGDRKPENISITEQPLRVVLADYGLSNQTNANSEPVQRTLGGTYLFTGLDRQEGSLNVVTFRDELLGLFLIYLYLIVGGYSEDAILPGSAELFPS